MANQFYSNSQSYTEIEQNVLDYIANYQTDLKDLTIQKLAYETFTSKSTIFRLTKKLWKLIALEVKIIREQAS